MDSIFNQPERKLKIAFVSREYPPSKRCGGISTYVMESATCLSSLGHEVYVVAASDDISGFSEYLDKGVHIIRLPGGDFFIGKKQSLINKLYSHFRCIAYYRSYRERVSNYLEQLVKEKGIELIEFPEYGNESLVWSTRCSNIPWIIRLHGSSLIDRASGKIVCFFKSPLKWWFGKNESKALKKASAISSCSQALADIESEFVRIPSENIQVIPNGISIQSMHKNVNSSDDFKEKHNFLNPAKFHIFSAGTITNGKGFAELVAAVDILRGEGMDVALTIAGKFGKLGLSLLEKTVHNLSYKAWLHLPGELPREDLPSLYAAADVVVFPSWWEPFGIVVIEAMAVGGLVIGSTAGGMREIISESENGFLVEPRSPIKLADKIRYVLNLTDLEKKQIRKAASFKILTSFNINNLIANQINFYRMISLNNNTNDR